MWQCVEPLHLWVALAVLRKEQLYLDSLGPWCLDKRAEPRSNTPDLPRGKLEVVQHWLPSMTHLEVSSSILDLRTHDWMEAWP